MAFKPDIYAAGDQYDTLLPPYIFDGPNGPRTDEEVLQAYLQDTFGQPQQQLSVLEAGAGTGRMTEFLLPYASDIICTDKFGGVLSELNKKHPELRTLQLNTRDITSEKVGGNFDLVGSFWSLSYPIGECLETIEADGKITPVADLEAGVRDAHAFIGRIVDLLGDEGRMVAQLFDSESAEQQAVTRIWEQLGPDPGGRRSFTREVLVDGLAKAAEARGKKLEVIHHVGQVSFTGSRHLEDFYSIVHAKGNPQLTHTDVFAHEVTALCEAYTNTDGTIDVPAGMYEFRIDPQ